MLRQLRYARNLLQQYKSTNIPSYQSFSNLSINPTVPLTQHVSLKLPEAPEKLEFGGNVETVVHRSFTDMTPCDVITLPGQLFNAPIRPDLVHRVVHWQLARRRQGTSKTKTRGEIAASGRKIRPQKGTGRSRQGARSSPIFRGGGRAHGPVPRNYDYPLPKNVRRNALRAVLSSKFACGQLWIVDSIAIPDSQTRNVFDAIASLGWKSALIIDDQPEGSCGVDSSFYRASSNVQETLGINVVRLNVYDMMSRDMLVMTRASLDHLENRYAKYEWLF